ncbi:uncharacterized protein PV06_06071 [Exophiala oligosperma]|uniref:Uncharacterized protein n=1 Tax=Exophiala oligosperma TaxID=215243 RepID=A0A0D2DHT8_9EURO|nr:uncharacterized protein PV06_06071 [Exophiala oligosperma]KIW42528.1 hypothetical protein PV06_06071 [Exophiala oligosperma]
MASAYEHPWFWSTFMVMAMLVLHLPVVVAARVDIRAISTDTPPAPIVTKSSSATRTDGCTFTAFTEPVIAIGPTKTEYTLTTYTSALYDCDGCEDIDVVVLGHIFVKASFTTTVTATNATTVTNARCSPTPLPTSSASLVSIYGRND